jgi:hypothetical protein
MNKKPIKKTIEAIKPIKIETIKPIKIETIKPLNDIYDFMACQADEMLKNFDLVIINTDEINNILTYKRLTCELCNNKLLQNNKKIFEFIFHTTSFKLCEKCFEKLKNKLNSANNESEFKIAKEELEKSDYVNKYLK